MRQPEIYNAKTIKEWDWKTELVNGRWVPARPYPHNMRSWIWRFRLAWLVFTGKCDALCWNDNKAND